MFYECLLKLLIIRNYWTLFIYLIQMELIVLSRKLYIKLPGKCLLRKYVRVIFCLLKIKYKCLSDWIILILSISLKFLKKMTVQCSFWSIWLEGSCMSLLAKEPASHKLKSSRNGSIQGLHAHTCRYHQILPSNQRSTPRHKST